MKVTHLAGSPRPKSNSTKLANRFNTVIEEMGGLVNSYHLNKLIFKGCQGCLGCKTGKERCIIKDDLTLVLDEIFETDVLVISTPVYFWELPGQLKLFIDRTYSFARDDWESNPKPSRLPEGKHLVFIQTQGADEPAHQDIYEKYDAIFKIFGGFAETHLIKVANTNSAYDVALEKDKMKLAEELAKKVATVFKNKK